MWRAYLHDATAVVPLGAEVVRRSALPRCARIARVRPAHVPGNTRHQLGVCPSHRPSPSHSHSHSHGHSPDPNSHRNLFTAQHNLGHKHYRWHLAGGYLRTINLIILLHYHASPPCAAPTLSIPHSRVARAPYTPHCQAPTTHFVLELRPRIRLTQLCPAPAARRICLLRVRGYRGGHAIVPRPG